MSTLIDVLVLNIALLIGVIIGMCLVVLGRDMFRRKCRQTIAPVKNITDEKFVADVINVLTILMECQQRVICLAPYQFNSGITDRLEDLTASAKALQQTSRSMKVLCDRIMNTSEEGIIPEDLHKKCQGFLVTLREQRGTLKDIKRLSTEILVRSALCCEIRTILQDAWDKLNCNQYLEKEERTLLKFIQELE